MERDGTRILLNRNRRNRARQARRDRPRPSRRDRRRGRAEGDWALDSSIGARPRRSPDCDHGGGLREGALSKARRARDRGSPVSARTGASARTHARCDRVAAEGPLCGQDRVLCAGPRTDARRELGIWLEARPWRDRRHLARRLHHPRAYAESHHEGVRRRAAAREPATRGRVPRRRFGQRTRVAARCRECGRSRRCDARLFLDARLFRRSPARARAGEPAAGPTRLFRR